MEGQGHTRLLQLESSFYLSCLSVRQSGKELAEMKNYLLKELLSIATIRSERSTKEQQAAEEEIRRLQERSEQQEVEVSRLHGLLQTTQPVAPGGVPLGGQRDEPREAGDSDHVSSEGCTTSTPPHTRRVTRKRRRAKSLAGRYKKTKTIKKENGLPSGTKLGQVIPPAPSASEELRSVDMKDNDVASSRECHMVASTEETTKRGSDREPSPEIPLQSQAKRVSSPTNLLDNLTELEGRGCGKIEESKPSEEVVTSLTELPRVGSEVERVAKCRESSVVAAEASQLKVGHEHAGAAGEREKHGAGVSMVKAAGRRRTTILSRKSQGPHLSVVEEQVSQGRRLAIKVNTRGFTAPKLKTDTQSD